MKKNYYLLIIALVLTLTLVACTQGSDAGGKKILRLAHTQSTTHPVHISMEKFAALVAEKTNDEIEIEIYPNGVLGDERKYVENLQAGTLDLAKVSVNALENFDEVWSIFGIPYVFEGEDHGTKFMDSEYIELLYESTAEAVDALGLTWYHAGSRNYYTKDTPIEKPEDLEGLIMRVQSSSIQIETAEAFGGSATPVDWGELYSAIQQGVVDGADNGIVAFTENNLGEAAKHFSFTEHVFSPDILLIKNTIFEGLTPEQQTAIKEAAVESTEFHSENWEKETQAAIEKSESIGVTIYYPELKPFVEKTQTLRDKYLQKESIVKYLELIEEIK